MAEKIQSLQFKISSELKNIIGKDLITDDFIAVFELVKNSYDAFAKNVIIKFEEDKIIIQDDGKGMTYGDLKNKWLFVAYSAKKEGIEDKIKDAQDKEIREDYRDLIKQRKYYAGAKGIGRFSCDRLGKKLKLITKSWKEDSSLEQIEVNWNLFEEDAEKEFVNISVQHQTLPENTFQELQHGTILEITGLHNSWPRSKLIKLKRSLEKLINPFESLDKILGRETTDFSIIVDVPHQLIKDNELKDKPWEIINGRIENFIFETLNIKTTFVSTEINTEYITTKLVDRGTHMFTIREANENYSLLSDVKIQLFFLNRAAKTNFTRRMGVHSVQFGSIFLFKNGFRVYPYGNEGDDSWGIDRLKQQGYARYLGTREVIGRVEIFGEGKVFSREFKETTSRSDGLVETEGRRQLIESYRRTAHRILQKYVIDVQWAYTDDPNLKDTDIYSEDITYLNNLKGKARISRVIRQLSISKNVEVLYYNQDFLNILEEKFENAPPEVFKDLGKVAQRANDEEFAQKVLKAEKKYQKLRKEKEETERKILQAEEARVREEELRKIAEKERNEAKLLAERKELERLRAEKEKLLEEKRRIESEKKAKIAEEEKEQVKQELEEEKKQAIFSRSLVGTEKSQIISLQHQIYHSASRIKRNLRLLLRKMSYEELRSVEKYISVISLESSKIESISNYVTKANFNLRASEIEQDLVQFIIQYIDEIYLADDAVIDSKLSKISTTNLSHVKYKTKFRPLEVTTMIDNFIQNAEKADASEITFQFLKLDSNLELIISDNGKGINRNNIEKIFNLGFSTTNGSGIGLYQIKELVNKMNGEISVESIPLKSTTFTISLLK